MLSQTIRRHFLQYFKEKGHTVLPSSPVIPHNDPTLLFNNAGMNQFKDVFLGQSERDYQKAATAQKCIRVGGKHNDLDNVGHTSRHLTFFEMLGNFSFGNYFKKEAITFAWEVSTQVFAFDPARIWISVFREDDEAYELWKQIVPVSRIVRLDEKDNFWAMGETGPCGPCSELYYDRGPSYGTAQSILHDTDGERFLEFWNLVFMQFNRNAQGQMTQLPKQSIDTGSGLERVVALKMDVKNVFQTDILSHLIEETQKLSSHHYDPQDAVKSAPFHVIADHIRSLSFAIADGAQPGNIERGYVLRKLIRRAVRYGRQLGLNQPFLAKLVPPLVQLMGDDYPELKASHPRIEEILTLEEESFLRTLTRGGNLLSVVTAAAQTRPDREITGEEAFKLKDTYGFPLEEILLLAKDYSLTVDLKAYQHLEEKAKETSKAAHQKEHVQVEDGLYQTIGVKTGPTRFTGYHTLEDTVQVEAIIMNNTLVSQIPAGSEGIIILNQTPFYKEMGGQIADTGKLFHASASLSVVSTKAAPFGLTAHHVVCLEGTAHTQDVLTAVVDATKRRSIQNAHTATHILHHVLADVLGSHLRQAGSVVEEERVRFDFNHHKALSAEEMTIIEEKVNEKITENHPVKTYEIPYEQAQKDPTIKQFFGDKYGHNVRVVDMDFSKELCGGTHTASTGTIGYFRILKESSIASGVRRIEAVTGKLARRSVYDSIALLEHKLQEQSLDNKQMQQKLKAARKNELKMLAQTLIEKHRKAHSIPVVITAVDAHPSELLEIAQNIHQTLTSSLILLAVKLPDKCHVLLKLSNDLVKRGWNASALLQKVLPIIQGSGGGKPDLAQAGGKNPHELETFLEAFAHIIDELS